MLKNKIREWMTSVYAIITIAELLLLFKFKYEFTMLLGAHVSISGGIELAIQRGAEIGCTSIQIFTKNQRQWKTPELETHVIKKYQREYEKSSLRTIIAHDSYLINLANPDISGWEKSCSAFIEEMQRAEKLNIPYLVFHPGAHKGAGVHFGINKIAESINYIHKKCPQFKLKILLETTSGQGTALGNSFEQLKEIINSVEESDRIGVCIDTCHIFTAGYDIRSKTEYEKTFEHFDKVVGLNKVYAIHLNDSKRDLASRIDRHEHIGKGYIGLETFRILMNDKRFSNIPKILETPGDLEDGKENMQLLLSLIE